jgi:ribonuclease P protein component
VPLNRNNDFKRVHMRGKTFAFPHVIIGFLKNNFKISRIGITASKKVGCAVKRNRARRIIRAAWCGVACRIKPGFDIVFVARYATANSDTKSLQREIFSAIKRFTTNIGNLNNKNQIINPRS